MVVTGAAQGVGLATATLLSQRSYRVILLDLQSLDPQVATLRDAGMKVADLCRKHGISDATFYNWRSRYGGMDVWEARRLRQLEEENQRLKRLVADQALDIQVLKEVLGKK